MHWNYIKTFADEDIIEDFAKTKQKKKVRKRKQDTKSTDTWSGDETGLLIKTEQWKKIYYQWSHDIIDTSVLTNYAV